ncbi:Leo1-like protein-domain-containing protein [Lineolata rhizophorae]|uniref:Leo1-like protein-domain-containing protein n=1 Tax=Lineolata rhizophorae TaxID=578093 RepID=A0A6A6PAU2_9PEZI|nr:Leo1-like protein-domain-containing protein [Lineolata rhizophorae]
MSSSEGESAASDAGRPVHSVEDDQAEGSQLENDGGDGIEDDDLFGDGEDDDADFDHEPVKKRQLDDEELDSGDDDGRNDRAAAAGTPDEPEETSTYKYVTVELSRNGVPEPSDNELYLFKVPTFLDIEPAAWNPRTFRPPTIDNRSKGGAPSESFSPYTTAMSAIRWRRSPSNPSDLQSNARVLRWSDGSLTLQLASDPLNQFEIDSNPLAPPQYNPPKPTPTSRVAKRGQPPYDPSKDSFTYLCAPSQSAGFLRVTNKITSGLTVTPPADSTATNQAIQRLQENMAAAIRARDPEANGESTLVTIDEDPEKAKREAEQAEKDRLRNQRRREAQEIRERERSGRAMARSGIRTYGGGAGAGEDGRSRAKGHRASRRDDYSDEDEGFGRGRARQDEYDEEDDFIAGSDEEPEIVEDDEDEEELELAPRTKKTSPKRNRPAADEREASDEVAVGGARSKRRRVIDEEDDEV